MQPIYIEYWGHEDEEVFAPMPDPKPIPSIDISWPVDNLGPYIDDLVFAQRDHHAVSDDVTILPQFVSYFKDILSNGINRIFEYLLRECVYLILSHCHVKKGRRQVNVLMYLLLFQITKNRSWLNDFNNSNLDTDDSFVRLIR